MLATKYRHVQLEPLVNENSTKNGVVNTDSVILRFDVLSLCFFVCISWFQLSFKDFAYNVSSLYKLKSIAS